MMNRKLVGQILTLIILAVVAWKVVKTDQSTDGIEQGIAKATSRVTDLERRIVDLEAEVESLKGPVMVDDADYGRIPVADLILYKEIEMTRQLLAVARKVEMTDEDLE